MANVNAIYEGGVFRPIEAVDLPERCRVQLVVHPFGPSAHKSEMEIEEARQKIYEILGRSFETGEVDLAARHDEFGP